MSYDLGRACTIFQSDVDQNRHRIKLTSLATKIIKGATWFIISTLHVYWIGVQDLQKLKHV